MRLPCRAAMNPLETSPLQSRGAGAGDEAGAGRPQREPQVVEDGAPVLGVLEHLGAERHVEGGA